MGYVSQVRYMTTKVGYDKIKKLATEKYDELLNKEIKKGKVNEKWSDDPNTICIDYNDRGFGQIYAAHLDTDYEIERFADEGYYVMFGWDWVKWLGYDHIERKAYDYACANCGEYVRCLMVGEDGAIEEQEWNEDVCDDAYMPYVGAYSRIDDDAWC